MGRFPHESLRVHRLAAEMAASAADIARRAPAALRGLSDQFLRSAVSVPLNIAEGSSEFRPAEKARFYRIARRSAAEGMSAINLMATAGAATKEEQTRIVKALESIGAMLTVMIRTQDHRAKQKR